MVLGYFYTSLPLLGLPSDSHTPTVVCVCVCVMLLDASVFFVGDDCLGTVRYMVLGQDLSHSSLSMSMCIIMASLSMCMCSASYLCVHSLHSFIACSFHGDWGDLGHQLTWDSSSCAKEKSSWYYLALKLLPCKYNFSIFSRCREQHLSGGNYQSVLSNSLPVGKESQGGILRRMDYQRKSV